MSSKKDIHDDFPRLLQKVATLYLSQDFLLTDEEIFIL